MMIIKKTNHTVRVITNSLLIRSAYQNAGIQSNSSNRFRLFETSQSVPSSIRDSRSQSVDQIFMTEVRATSNRVSNPNWKAVVEKSHKIIFADSLTRPSQIGELTQSLHVKPNATFGVFDHIDFLNPETSDLIRRICHSFTGTFGQDAIVSAVIVDGQFRVTGPRLRRLIVPVSEFRCLANYSMTETSQFVIERQGRYLHWPQGDIYLGWNQFLQASDPVERLRAEQRNIDYNRRYGRAIRQFREERQLKQNKIPGVTERQIRRIESGESRATTKAIRSLSDAHGLTVNQYMNEVATRLG